jgi:hypothetical protein
MSKAGANAPTDCSLSANIAGGRFASAIPPERGAKIGPEWVRFAEHRKAPGLRFAKRPIVCRVRFAKQENQLRTNWLRFEITDSKSSPANWVRLFKLCKIGVKIAKSAQFCTMHNPSATWILQLTSLRTKFQTAIPLPRLPLTTNRSPVRASLLRRRTSPWRLC